MVHYLGFGILPNAPIKSKVQHPPPPPRANPGNWTIFCARGVGNLTFACMGWEKLISGIHSQAAMPINLCATFTLSTSAPTQLRAVLVNLLGLPVSVKGLMNERNILLPTDHERNYSSVVRALIALASQRSWFRIPLKPPEFFRCAI